MTTYIYVVALVCACATAAPPAPPLFPQPAPAHLQQISPYSQSPGISSFYNPDQQKQGQGSDRGTAAYLETLEPDSEVEYIPGAQPPQQPPQQTPLTPNLPGLLPGQRVFIVHMPVPGYSPGSIAGYQPVYVVGAAPQGNAGYTPNGYLDAGFLNPSGYPRPGAVGLTAAPQGNAVYTPNGYLDAGFLNPSGYPQPGASGLAAAPQGKPVYTPNGYLDAGFLNPSGYPQPGAGGLAQPVNLLQQAPAVRYQPGAVVPGDDAAKGPLRLAQLVALQGPQATVGAAPGLEQSLANSEAKRLRETSERLAAKGASEEAARGRPATGAQIRKP